MSGEFKQDLSLNSVTKLLSKNPKSFFYISRASKEIEEVVVRQRLVQILTKASLMQNWKRIL